MPRWVFQKKIFRDKLATYLRQETSLRHEASFLSFSHSTLQRIARGKKEPTMSEFMELCNRMEVEPVIFFDEDWYQKEMF